MRRREQTGDRNGRELTLRSIKRKRIGVLMGGTSSEREVSLRSGGAIYTALKSAEYDVLALDAKGDLCALLKKAKIDIAFIALHGGHGENGALQGMLEIMNIPYTGSGILASAIAMDKEASKKAFVYHGLPVPPFDVVKTREKGAMGRGGATAAARKSAADPSPHTPYSSPRFPLPWVVKPASEGSSVGVEIVKRKPDLAKALGNAFAYDDRVIVEKYIGGREVQIAILNDRVIGGVEVKPSLEFYSYEAKYTAGLTEYIFPPRLNSKTYSRAKKTALSAHMALGCSGATRVDLLVDADGTPFVLEVNTIPGMTETSLLPKIAKNAGLDFIGLLEEILGGVSGER